MQKEDRDIEISEDERSCAAGWTVNFKEFSHVIRSSPQKQQTETFGDLCETGSCKLVVISSTAASRVALYD